MMGDSILKYRTTLFLYTHFPNYEEGQLTELRGKLVSNQRLRHLGEAKGLGGILAGGIFYPLFNFLPPSYCGIEKCERAAMGAKVALAAFSDISKAEIQVSISHKI